MPRRKTSLILLGSFLALIIFIHGCSVILPPKKISFASHIRKKVAVMPFADNVGLSGEPFTAEVADMLASQLDGSSRIIIVPREIVQDYVARNQVPLPLTQNTATLVGRALGLNAVITGSISELNQTQRRTGWLRWFTFLSKKKDFVGAVITAEVVDVGHGTLLTSDVGKGEVQSGESEDDLWGSQTRQGPDPKLIDASLEQAVAAMGETIRHDLEEASWKGFIIRVEGDTAVLKGGGDVGIRAGDPFTAYDMSNRITNAAGQTYVIPGKIKAELEAAEVGEDTATLTVVSGRIEPGDVVINLGQ